MPESQRLSARQAAEPLSPDFDASPSSLLLSLLGSHISVYALDVQSVTSWGT